MTDRAPPPTTRREEISETLHGVQVADPYRWLEDVKAAEVKRWMLDQNAHTRRQLDRLPGRERLRARLRELSYIDFETAPLRRGKNYFYSRLHKDKEKRVYYWRRGEQGAERVLIDPNKLSDDGTVSVKGVYPSWDGELVAYKLSENNADAATLYLMTVATGEISKVDVIRGAKYAAPSWTPSGDGFYYTRLPVDPKIPISDLPGHAAVYFHKLGQDPGGDRLVHEKTGDPTMFISVHLAREGRFLFLYKHHGWTSTDIYYCDLKGTHPGATQEKFLPLRVDQKALYSVFAWQDQIYLHTNEGAPRYRLFRVTPGQYERSKWSEIIEQDKEAVLNGASVRGGRLALDYLERASGKLVIADLEGKKIADIQLPEIGSVSNLSGNPQDDTAYYSFTSFLRPTTIYKLSINSLKSEVHFKPDIPIEAAPYISEQVMYKSKDGTPVSMFIVRPRWAKKGEATPYMLTGYGGFNISLTPQFRGSRFVWLEQGGALAIPNLRGGGEYGESWHRDGMRDKKQNVFDDFIAAAEYLIREKYTSARKLAISGGSNGGLLVGAAMTQRPELFRAVNCAVPLLDMVRYHRFGSGKTWISEYGSADDPEQFKVLYAYSPYHHVQQSTAYPAMIMMSADSDDRVDPMHARKFTAAIQHATTSKHPVLFRLETNAGHGGGDMVKKQVEAAADVYSFLMNELGMTPGANARSPERPKASAPE